MPRGLGDQPVSGLGDTWKRLAPSSVTQRRPGTEAGSTGLGHTGCDRPSLVVMAPRRPQHCPSKGLITLHTPCQSQDLRLSLVGLGFSCGWCLSRSEMRHMVWRPLGGPRPCPAPSPSPDHCSAGRGFLSAPGQLPAPASRIWSPPLLL